MNTKETIQVDNMLISLILERVG